jgi:2-polyprenyl-6-methoxyphenol hydroxylase-like FAD-dependent oxidoreductase
MSQPPRIAVIGAGPAGLTLARLLHISDVALSVTIFEKDAPSTARQQVGGTLDLHSDTGLAALGAAGLLGEFEKYARYDGEALVIADKNATRVVSKGGGTKEKTNDLSRPEIDRERLREILLASVPKELVRWGWKLRSVSEDGTLGFDGQERQGPFDLIVGADGAWSKVRPMLTDVRPAYSGISGFELRFSNPNQDYPKLSAMVGRGSYLAMSDGKALMAQRLGDESIKLGCWMVEDASYPQDIISQHGVDEAKTEILRRYSDWAPDLLDLVKCSDPGYNIPCALYELPVGHTWEHKKGLSLIGDAAALMTPFAGEGVNKAMKDALELSAAICKSQKPGGDDLDVEVSNYEKHMFPRVARVQAHTLINKTTIFRDDAPLGLLMALIDAVADRIGLGYILGRIVATAVWPVAFLYFWLRITFGRLTRRFWTRN